MHTVDFYYMPESPPCRLVEMVAELAGVSLQKIHTNLFQQEHLKEEHVKLNPRHKVPFIVDGPLKMTESRAIACYLVNKYMPANNTLYPSDPVKRAPIDELLYYDASVFYHSSSAVVYPLIKGLATEFDPEKVATLDENMKFLDEKLERDGNKFLTGDNLTLADISVVVTLQMSQSLEYDFSRFKHVNKFLENVKAAVPKYAEINEKPIENLKNFVKSQVLKSK